jgi:hypothetical protein
MVKVTFQPTLEIIPMAIQITSEQIKASNIITSLLANDAVTAAKLDQSGSFDFTSGTVAVAAPTADNHAASKTYVDSLVSGLHWKDAARVATTADLAATYNNGSSGVGATLTANANGAISIDGVSLSANDRVLVKNQASGTEEENGLYKVSTVGDASTAFVLTRTTDADTPAKLESLAVFVLEGTANSDAGYVLTSDGISAIGTDSIEFSQFSGAGSITAGDGLSKSGNTISVNLATDPGLEFSGGALKAKVDGSTLTLGSSGLFVKDGGIGTSKLSDASVTQAKIGTAAVGSSQLASNAVTAAKLSDGAVSSSAKLSDGIVVAAKLAADCIDQSKIADGAVQREHLNSNVVMTNGGLTLDGTNNDLAVQVDDSTIAINGGGDVSVKDAGIGASQLASNAVTTVKVGNAQITTAKLAGDCIDQSKIADGAVQREHLNANVVMANGGLTLDDTNNDLAVQVDDSTIAINGGGDVSVKDAGIGASQLASNAVTAAKIASNAIVTDKISSSAVTATKIANGAIDNADKLGSSVVTNAKISDGTIELGKLAFSSRQEKFTGDNSTASFDLANAAAGLDSVHVFRNGLRMEKASSPSGADQYSVQANGAVSQITFGSAPDTGDVILVDYLG